MKKIQKVVVVLLALTLILSLSATAFAAKPGDPAGGSTTITGYAFNGNIVAGKDAWVLNGWSASGDNWWKADAQNPAQQSHTYSVSGTIADGVTSGTYEVGVVKGYLTVNENGTNPSFINQPIYVTITIDEPEPSTQPSTEPSTQPSTEPSTQPSTQPSTPGGGGGGGGTGVGLDYTELRRQIGIAEGLDENDWTKESWDAMIKVLEEAKKLLWHAKTQQEIDDLAKKLADAIAALVPVDNDRLKQAIKDGTEFGEGDPIGNLWWQLYEAIQKGKELLDSNDQKAKDAQADLIYSLIEQIKKMIEDVTQGRDIIKEVEVEKVVEKEVGHDGLFCNIPYHKFLEWAFPIAGAGDIGLLIALLAKKKKKDEDVPVANYDISEDK